MVVPLCRHRRRWSKSTEHDRFFFGGIEKDIALPVALLLNVAPGKLPRNVVGPRRWPRHLRSRRRRHRCLGIWRPVTICAQIVISSPGRLRGSLGGVVQCPPRQTKNASWKPCWTARLFRLLVLPTRLASLHLASRIPLSCRHTDGKTRKLKKIENEARE